MSTVGQSTLSASIGSSSYRYCALPGPDYFRILSICPGTADDPIVTELSLWCIGNSPGYEALSYHWGDCTTTVGIKVCSNNESDIGDQELAVRQNLESALKSLRYKDKHRHLWIDAICIDQNDGEEKASQIPRMAEIFHNALTVAVWLGDESDDSSLAMSFVKRRVLDLGILDSLLADPETDKEWAALSKLMRRAWFTRKWVVQEIAFAKEAILYCGRESISWVDFADAVALFADHEAESKVVSRMIKGSRTFGNDADYFGDIQALGAVQLVGALKNLLSKTTEGNIQERLLTLEYLVSSLATFRATKPHDAIYALFTLSKDAWVQIMREQRVSNPESPSEFGALAKSGPGSASPRSPMPSYYGESSTEALVQKHNESPVNTFSNSSWISTAFNASHGKANQSDILGAQDGHASWSFTPSTWANLPVVVDVTKDYQVHTARKSTKGLHLVDYSRDFGDVCREFVTFVVRSSQSLDIICRAWAPVFPSLPSWIPTVKKASYGLRPDGYYSRVNADSLVGLPGLGSHKYTASGSTSPTWEVGRHPSLLSTHSLTHGNVLDSSLFVEGFVLDKVEAVMTPALEGIIPPDWLELGGWADASTAPPERLWRTLVADRTQDGDRPPRYYARAFQHALAQTVQGGVINTQNLISRGGSTIVAKFLRRVQAVIWMRRLVNSKSRNFIGIAPNDTKPDDLVCVLYGCSVPVVLRKVEVAAVNSPAKPITSTVDGDASKSPENPSLNAEGTKRRRLTRALQGCTRCRMRKQKCDENLPTCGYCQQEALPCEYRKPTSHLTEPARLSQACKRCRMRKQKCDETQPSCGPCQQESLHCDYRKPVRASQACTHCRMRKQKCDENRPSCGYCQQEYLQCEYRERPSQQARTVVYYTVVGECYIHGMMDGEALSLPDIAKQPFQLR